ncbi:unnamed protein product [Strongylus vulgaris]|uniref:Uncharacterized protein n=1 Tax=Strongylus vulgaris TaxID=40348 RepID=A0A3P7LWD6_STRVU|nr:unnamed protein product [Strongylus vulgaris]
MRVANTRSHNLLWCQEIHKKTVTRLDQHSVMELIRLLLRLWIMGTLLQ